MGMSKSSTTESAADPDQVSSGQDNEPSDQVKESQEGMDPGIYVFVFVIACFALGLVVLLFSIFMDWQL